MLSKRPILVVLSLMARVGGFVTTIAPTFRQPHHRAVAMAAFWNDAGTLVDDFYHTQPYLAAFLTCSVKASAADILAQTRQAVRAVEAEQPKRQHTVPMPMGAANGYMPQARALLRQQQDHHQQQQEQPLPPPPLDISRNVGFLLYGGIYQGMVQNFLFNHFYPHLFGHVQPAWMTIAAQVSMDTMVTCPCVCLPLAYIIKALFTTSSTANYDGEHRSGATIIVQNEREGDVATPFVTLHPRLEAALTSGLAQYWHDVMHNGLLQTYWFLWIPVQTLTFAVVSPAYRIVFVACVSFFWVALLSSTMANSQERQQEPVPPLLPRPDPHRSSNRNHGHSQWQL